MGAARVAYAVLNLSAELGRNKTETPVESVVVMFKKRQYSKQSQL